MNNPQENSFAVSPVIEVEVLDQINNLDESKAPDCNDIPAKLIKAIQSSINKPLTDIINTSFSTGYYMYSRLIKFLEKNKILYPHQFGLSKEKVDIIGYFLCLCYAES